MSIPFESALARAASDQKPKSGPKPGIADHQSETEQHEHGTSGAIFSSEVAPQATRYAMSILRSWTDAEEVVQEAFCRLIESGTLDPAHADDPQGSGAGKKAVLFATVRNLSVDWLRKQGRRKFEHFDARQIPASQINRNEMRRRLARLEMGVQAVLKKMPSEWADALQLKINGDLSYHEISNVLGATHGQVRTWIYRARKQMAKDLKRQGLLDGGNDDE